MEYFSALLLKLVWWSEWACPEGSLHSSPVVNQLWLLVGECEEVGNNPDSAIHKKIQCGAFTWSPVFKHPMVNSQSSWWWFMPCLVHSGELSLGSKHLWVFFVPQVLLGPHPWASREESQPSVSDQLCIFTAFPLDRKARFVHLFSLPTFLFTSFQFSFSLSPAVWELGALTLPCAWELGHRG